jgi:small subunit ribosomal protein S6
MPLYELIYFIKPNASLATVAECMKVKANKIFDHGGVIRKMENMGIMPLAYPMFRHREKHFKARWIVMLFDASPRCVNELRQQIASDMNVFRWAFYKQKDPLRDKYNENLEYGKYRGEEDVRDRYSEDQRALVRTVMARIQQVKRKYNLDRYKETLSSQQ